MSRKGRIALLALAGAIAVFVFVLARPEEGNDRADDPGGAPARQEEAGRSPGSRERSPTARAESAPPPPPFEVRLRGGRPAGGVQSFEVERGDTVRLVVSSDGVDEIHLHGYDLTRETAPGRPARFRLEAELEGAFEIESHTAEDAGQEALIARLVVEPS